MATVTLKEFKAMKDWLDLRAVRVKPEQRKFTTNPVLTYLQSRHHAVTTFGVYVKEELVGYVLLIHADNPAQWIVERLTIDRDHQRKGYGSAVLDQMIDTIYDFENSEMVVVRYDPDNEAARQLVKKLKFEEQETKVRGRNVALLEFEFEETEDVDEEVDEINDDMDDADGEEDDNAEIDDGLDDAGGEEDDNVEVDDEIIEEKDSKTLSQERYTEYADGYVTSETHATGSDLDRLLDIADPQSDWIALDIATGGGHTALKFAPHVEHMTASDLTPRMLEKAKAFIAGEKGLTDVDFDEADAEDLPYEDEQFDLVTCRIAPHHFPNVQAFVNECARVLVSDGILLVQDHVLPEDEESARYVDEFETVRDPSHNRAFNESEWKAMFESAGLTVEHTEEYIKRHDFWDWVERQGNDDDTIDKLIQMMNDAPDNAKQWMDAQDWGTESATFVNHHILIKGRKA